MHALKSPAKFLAEIQVQNAATTPFSLRAFAHNLTVRPSTKVVFRKLNIFPHPNCQEIRAPCGIRKFNKVILRASH